MEHIKIFWFPDLCNFTILSFRDLLIARFPNVKARKRAHFPILGFPKGSSRPRSSPFPARCPPPLRPCPAAGARPAPRSARGRSLAAGGASPLAAGLWVFYIPPPPRALLAAALGRICMSPPTPRRAAVWGRRRGAVQEPGRERGRGWRRAAGSGRLRRRTAKGSGAARLGSARQGSARLGPAGLPPPRPPLFIRSVPGRLGCSMKCGDGPEG